MFEHDKILENQDGQETVKEIQVFCDGSSPPHHNGKMKYGHVAKDGEGNTLWKIPKEVPSAPGNSSNVAEYLPIIDALKRLIKKRLQENHITIISDSQLAIYQIQGRYKIKSKNLLPHYNEVMRLAPKFKNLKFKWVPRDENSEADSLTRD